MGSECRWINLILPGFDGKDERRGDYNGSAEHISQLILMIMKHLKIGKIIFCGHSLGSIFGAYFLTKYSEYV
jgi:pimeloyl-ACP methyl ester carboxylesterase